MLKAEKITRKFGNLTVLNEVDIHIKEGEMVSIIGSSGAGKSTFLHILGTLDKPNAGKLWIKDQAISNLSPKEIASFRNKNIGFIFQFHHLLPEFDALENISVPGWIAGKPKKQVKEKAMELLALLGLENRWSHKPQQLSGGEQQRVAVARALINDPAIVFADEPTGNLDSTNARQLHQIFVQLNKEMNTTFLIVTHNEELARMSTRVLPMKDGKMLIP